MIETLLLSLLLGAAAGTGITSAADTDPGGLADAARGLGQSVVLALVGILVAGMTAALCLYALAKVGFFAQLGTFVGSVADAIGLTTLWRTIGALL